MGQMPFEHPGAPRVAPGGRYMPNQVETEFATQSRSTLMSNFIRHVAVGALTPYISLRGLSVLQKRVIPTTRYVTTCELISYKMLHSVFLYLFSNSNQLYDLGLFRRYVLCTIHCNF